MDTTTALQQLFNLTGSLQPSPSANASVLRAARVAIAQSLLSQAPQIIPTPPPSTQPMNPQLQTELESVLAEATTIQAAQPGQRFIVYLRQLPIVSSLYPGSASPAVAGMAAGQSFGPFLGPGQLQYWLDLYPIVVQATVTRAPATAPFLSIPVELLLHPAPDVALALGPGSFWFQSPLLAAAAPAGSWTGIKIRGGSIMFSPAPTYAGGTIEIAATATVTVNLQLDFVANQPGGTGPGGDARAASAQLPADVTLVFGPSGASVTAASDATLTVYGTTLGLHWNNAAPQYFPALQQIVVPFTSSLTAFAPQPAVSDMFSLSGSAPIALAGWGLPVTITTAASLGQAAGAGTLDLQLNPGLLAQWRGANQAALVNQAWITVQAGEIVLLAPAASNSRLTEEFQLWQEAAPSTRRSTLDVSYLQAFSITYISISTFGAIQSTEIVWTNGTVTAHIDRPVSADGLRLGPQMPGLVFLYEVSAGAYLLVIASATPVNPPPAPIAFALHNALLTTTPPQKLLLLGKLAAGNAIDNGALLLDFSLYSLLPTAPDPYAANFYPVGQSLTVAGAVIAPNFGVLFATVTWVSLNPTLAFTLASLAGLPGTISILQPTPDPEASLTDPVAIQNQQNIAALESLFTSTIGSGPERLLLILDVSTNADQLGVGVGEQPRYIIFAEAASSASSIFSTTGLDLVTQGVNVRTITTPQIQWEPVVNLPNPDGPFPSPVAFWDDGGPTVMASPSVDLVPIAPIPVINQILSSYQSGNPAAVLFTLPFGMKAVATLPKPFKVGPIPMPRPGLTMVQPTFTAQNIAGGRQVSMTAARALLEVLGSSAASPTLPGATVQLRNLINPTTLAALDLSMLGNSVDPVFNETFGPGSQTAAVPVTRMDLSGYGASMFSDWVDPNANPPAVVQARFDVITGRTAYEVVKVKSILYPWGAAVVRTVTIQRNDNAEVWRWDSGWVAATPGIFNLSGITVHPGAVPGMYNITNISDTSQVYSGSGGLEMTAVYFDADVQLNGIVTGATNGLVPTSGQLGFVQTAPVGSPLTAAQLAQLLTAQGPLGGPVDCVLNVGNSGQIMRVGRVEVGNAPASGGSPQFAAVARGSVVLPNQGSWSILERTDSVSEPQAIDPNFGVPLIRQGAASMTGANTNPYRFAEAVDLLEPDTPSLDYCLLHTTTAARTLFPRPKIESGATALTSTVTPLVADAFAMLNATGLYPRQDTCTPYPNSNYSLQISGPGQFTLNLSPNPFTISQPPLTLAGSAGMGVTLEYADENSNPTQVNVSIAPASWSFSESDVCVRMDLSPFNGLVRIAGSVQASNTTAPNFPTSRVVFSSVLAPAQTLITILEALGLPDPLTLAISNATQKFKLQGNLQLKLGTLQNPIQTPLGNLAVVLKVGFGNSAASGDALLSSTSTWFLATSFSGTMQVAVLPPIPIYVGGMIMFSLEGDFASGSTPAKETITLQAGVVFAVGTNLGILSAGASVTYAYQLTIVVTSPQSIGVGLVLILFVSAGILNSFPGGGSIVGGLVSISFTAEALATLTLQPSPCQLTAAATFLASVDLTLAWFIDISFSFSISYSHAVSC